MNKIYKLIWSQTANAFVAVSELASARGKSSSTTNNAASSADKKAGIFKPVKTALALSMLFALPHSVMAAENVDANNLTVAGTSTFTGAATFNGGITANSITVGGKAVATSDQITNLETNKADKTAVDALSNQKADKTTVDALSNQKADKTAVDALSNQKADKTAVDALEANKADKTAVDALSNRVTTLGLTDEYSGIKYFRVKSTDDDAKAKATDSVAVGPKAYTETSATKGIAIGNAAQAGSKTSGEVTYDGAGSFMIGDGESSLAIGDSAAARGNQNIAIGKSALTTNKDAKGQLSSNSIAIGTETKTIAASNAIALGNQAVAGAKGAVADSAIAIGDNAKALAADATAVGHLAQAGNFGLAAGTNAQATGQASVALGQNAVSTSQSTVAIGTGAQALPWRTISIGQDAGKNQAADKVGDKNEHINIGVQAGENIDGQLNISIGQKAGSDTKGKGNIALGQNAGQFVGGANSSVGNNIAIGTNANKYATNTDVQETTAIGFGATAEGTRSVALGKETKSTAVDSVAIGTSSQANGASSVAIGLNANVNGADNVALGSSSVANTKAGTGYLTAKQSSTVVSVGNDTLQRRIVNVADGADDQDAVTVAQLKRTSDDVFSKVNAAINNLPANSGSGINYDTTTRPGQANSITLKKDTVIGNVAPGVLDTDAVNVAQLNQTVEENKTHYFSTKVNGATQGNYNNNGAQGDISLAIGMDVRSTGDRSVTVGNRSTAESKGGIAIGALYDGSAALDDNEAQNAVQTVAKSSNGQPFEYNMAIGAGASSEGNNSIAIGSLAKTSTKQQNNTSPDRAIAIGYFAAASDVKANAIGDRATSSAEMANAFGSQATSEGVSSTAIGTVAHASGENSIAMGTHQRVTGANSGSIGYAGDYTPTNVGREISGTHANNATLVSGTGTYSVGNTNSTVTSNESGIFGNDNFIQAKENVRVVGNKNTVTNQGSAANSPTAVTPTLKDVYITGHNNQVDVAAKPMENSKNLFVMGAANKVGTEGALTITDSYVIGTNNTINTSNTASDSDDPSNPGAKVGKGFFILGNNVTATKENSVYLGTDAAYTAKGDSTDGDAAVTEPVTVGGTLAYGDFAGKTPVGVVTVGDVGKERRIQNVAAGKIAATSTDAINGSQLYATNAKLGNVANTVVENFGGNATLNPDGSITYTNIGNTGQNNIHDAIKAATTKVEEADGIKVVPTTNADGSTTYTVSAKTDGTTTKIDGNGNIAAVTTTFTPSTDGKVGAPVGNGDSLVTANTVADAINNSGWKLAADGTTGTELINPSDTVTFKTGSSNLTVKRDGANITYDLAKDININSVQIGANGPTINNGGIDMGDTKITNLTAGDVNSTSTDAVNGSQLYAVSEVANAGWNIATDSGTAAASNVKPDGTATFNGDGKNIAVTNVGNTVTVALTKDINVDSITLNGKNGADGISITGAVGTPGVNGTDGITRIIYEDPTTGKPTEVATLNDGLKFAGNTGDVIAKKLNETLSIEGKLAAAADSTGENLRVDSADGKLNLVMAKDLTDLNSIVINGGPTINGNGIDMGGDKITNLAKGDVSSTSTDAVNGSQLYAVSEVANAGWNIATDSGTAAASNVKPDGTATFNGDGKNIAVTNVGNTVTVALTKDINVDSITLNGKNGADGISITGAVGTPGVNGTDGITRIIYEDPTTGKPTEVATLNDGLKFAGNTGDVIAKKLNETLSIEGKLAAAADSTGENLRVDSADGKLNLVMAKDLTDLNSIVINGGPTINGNGIDMGGDKITNLAKGDVSSTSTDAVNGSQLYAVSEVANAGWNIATDSGTAAASNVKPDGTATFNGDGKNIAVTNVGNTVTVALTKDINVDSITLNGKNGADGISITGAVGTPGVNGTDGITRIIYEDPTTGKPTEVATLNDGLKFAGNTGDVIAKKLNETLSIEGKLAAAADSTGENLRVDSADGKLNLVMAKDLTDLNSIVINGGPTINGNGIDMGGDKITNLAKGDVSSTSTDAVNGSQLYAVSQVANAGWNIATDSGKASNVKPGDTVNMKGDGSVVVSNTGNDVTVGLADVVTVGQGDTAVTIDGTKGTIQAGTEVTIDGNTGVIQAGDVTINGDKGTVNGLSNITWDANNIVSGQAATEDQLKAVADNVTTAVGAAKTEVEAGKNVTVSSQLGDKGQTIYTVATKDEVDFNKVTVGGLTIDKTHVDDAGKTIISGVGAGEISSISTDAVNGSQLHATNQQVTQNTTDITNINSTLDKGLNFSADSGTAVNRKLGDTVAITGDGNITTTTTANGVQVKLSDSINVNNVTVNQNLSVAEGATVNMGGNVIQNVAPGVNGTDAVNVNQVNAVAGNLNNRINSVGHIANAGVAQAIATAGLPQAYLPGKNMMAIAGGTYEGEAGYAIGFSTISDNGKWVIKATGSGNSRGKFGASIGAGYQW